MYSAIDNEIYSFIGRLEKGKLNGMPDATKDRIGAAVFDIGPVENVKLLQTDPTGSHISIFQDVDGIMVGLSEKPYSEFKTRISDFQDLPPFDSKASFSFIEEHSFQWLIDVYKAKRAERSLSTYLLDRLDAEYRSYTFFIPIVPLTIQAPFSIGNTEVSFLTESFIAAETEKFETAGNPKEQLDIFLSQFTNKVLATVSAKGTFEKAKQIAFRKATSSMDVLKCFLHEYSIYNQFKIPDLNFRQSISEMTPVLHSTDSDSFSLEALFFRTQHAAIIDIGQDQIAKFNQEKLDKFCHFLTHPKDTEFHQAVSEAIHSFARYVSTTNWHEKVAKLITFFESILINAQTKAGGGENILKKQLMPKMFGSSPDCKLGIELSGTFYRIRDAYVHHGIERGIDARKLYQFQIFAFRFLRWLVELNTQIDTMESFYDLLKTP
jgi:hypothetical protein